MDRTSDVAEGPAVLYADAVLAPGPTSAKEVFIGIGARGVRRTEATA